MERSERSLQGYDAVCDGSAYSPTLLSGTNTGNAAPAFALLRRPSDVPVRKLHRDAAA